MEVKKIIKICNIASGVDITEKCREKEYVYGRSIFYNFMKIYHPTMSYTKIGKLVNVSHATILFSLSQSKHSYFSDPMYVAIHNKATDLLKNPPNSLEDNDEYIKELEFYIPENIISYINSLKYKINILSLENSKLLSLVENNTIKEEEKDDAFECLNDIPKDKLPEFIETRVVPYVKMLKLNTTYESKRILTE